MHRKVFPVVLSLVAFLAVGAQVNAEEPVTAPADVKVEEVTAPVVPQPTDDECVVKEGQPLPDHCVINKDDAVQPVQGEEVNDGDMLAMDEAESHDEAVQTEDAVPAVPQPEEAVEAEDNSDVEDAVPPPEETKDAEPAVPQPADHEDAVVPPADDSAVVPPADDSAVECAPVEEESHLAMDDSSTMTIPEDAVDTEAANEAPVQAAPVESAPVVPAPVEHKDVQLDTQAAPVAPAPAVHEEVKPVEKAPAVEVPAKQEAVEPPAVEAAPDDANAVQEQAGVFKDRLKKFDVKFPEKWELRKGMAGMYVVGISPLDGPNDKFRENVNIASQILDQPIELKAFFDEGQKALSEQLPGFKLIGVGDMTVGGLPVKWIEFSQSSGNIDANVKQFYIIAEGGKRAFIITGASPPEEFTKFRPVMDQIVQSFHFNQQ